MTTLLKYMDNQAELKLDSIRKFMRPHLNVNGISLKGAKLYISVDKIHNEAIQEYLTKLEIIKSSNNLKSIEITTRGGIQ